MSQTDFQLVAQHLRQPQGDMGREVGHRMNKSNEFMYNLTLSQLNLQPNQRILEIGMGNGFFVKDIVSGEATIRYDGCDFSETMVAESVALNQEWVADGRVHFHQASADALPFTDQTFDRVLTINTIYFWENPAVELAEIRRLLKPNGLFLIAIRTKSSMEHLPFTPYGFHLYDSADLSDLLTENGFAVNSIIKEQEPEHGIAGEVFNMVTILMEASPL